ncbi:hypothetical protein BH11MYX1_BH11MYX1_09470 [soil metagenome]
MPESSEPWLTAVIEELRLHAEAAVLRRLDVGSPSQLYLRDPAALARVTHGTLRPQGAHRKATAEVEAAIADASAKSARLVAGQAGPESRLSIMTRRLGIDPAASGLVAAALAYALDLDTRELVHALAPRKPPALYLATCADVLELSPIELLGATAQGSPLRRGRVLAIEGSGLDAAIELSPAMLAWLLGDDALQPPIAGTCELGSETSSVVLPAGVIQAFDAIVPRARAKIAVVLRGPRGSGRRAAAQRLANALGRPLMTIPIPALLTAEKRAGKPLLAVALAAAQLHDAVPYLGDADSLYDESGTMAAEHADAISEVPGAIAVASTGRGGHLDLRRPALIIAMPRTELEDRQNAWANSLVAAKGPVEHAMELGARYVIGPGAIADVVGEAAKHAVAARAPL